MGAMSLIDRQNLAEKIIASGDLYPDGCSSEPGYKRKKEAAFTELTGIIYELIAPFGAAGLRDLAVYATEQAEEEEFRDAIDQMERERRAAQDKFSDFDKLSLLIAVNRVDGGQRGYDKAADLVSAGRYTAREVCLLSTEQLRKLLVGLNK